MMNSIVNYDENRPKRPADIIKSKTLRKIYALSNEDWEEINESFPKNSPFLKLISYFKDRDNIPLHADEMASQIGEEKWLSANTKRLSDALKWHDLNNTKYFFRFIRVKPMTPYYVFVKILLSQD